MRSSRRTEIRGNSLEREIRKKTCCTRSKHRGLKDGPNFKKIYYKYAGANSKWRVRDHECTGSGRWPIRSETVLQGGANSKRHRFKRIVQTYKVVLE